MLTILLIATASAPACAATASTTISGSISVVIAAQSTVASSYCTVTVGLHLSPRIQFYFKQSKKAQSYFKYFSRVDLMTTCGK